MKYLKGKFNEYIAYDETSPSGLRWIKLYSKSSRAKIGNVVGSLDKRDGYWRIHALGSHYKAHKIVWALLKEEPQTPDLHIDHLDGDRSNNVISNLRLVTPTVNAQNTGMAKNNTTGVTGVGYSEGLTKLGTFYSKYTAFIYFDGGKVSSTFSVQKYGKEQAFKLAVDWRETKVSEYMATGKAHFTERHGK